MASESLMNTAGRQASHTFSDVRSAAYAQRWVKKYPRKQSRRKRNCCEWCNPPRNDMRVHIKKQALKHARYNDYRGEIYIQYKWDQNLQWMDEIVQYERFGKRREIFEGRGSVVDGETFTAWAQRRIAEMRAVKEDRLRAAQQSHKININTVSRGEVTIRTTLPTTAEDKHAHDLLHDVLSVNKYFRWWCRVHKIPPFHSIEGFGWFGEFSWKWHRNESGCWVLGHGECGEECLPCPHCCDGNGYMCFPCYCKEFEGVPAPEDVQRCSLLEWVSGRLWRFMQEDEARREEMGVVELVVGASDEEWDVVSDVASDDWSVVGSDL